MVEYIVGDYQLQKNDVLISEFSPNVFYKTEFNKDKCFVLFAEDLKLDKEKIDFINKNATANIKIVTVSNKLVNGIRAKNNVLVKKSGDDEFNPFEFVKFILSEKNRESVLDYLLSTTPSLWMPVKVLTSNFNQLNEQNRKCVCFLDLYLWRVDREILYHYIAFKFKPEYVRFLKWNYKKK